MPDIKDVLKKVRPRELTVPVCLAGDLAAEVERLEAKLSSLSEWRPDSIADQNPGIEIAEKIASARREMQESEVEFTFRALGAEAWSDLVAMHPGKTDEEAWDVDTLQPALVAASCVDPVMTREQLDELFEGLNLGQRQQLLDAAWQVNGEATSVPFSLHASAILASHTDGK
ncbi:hypothetical protein ACWGI0_23275 [Streptomyces sp. NPDC054802]